MAYIGEIRLFAGNFAPKGWAACDGQMVAVWQYPALFSILRTTYGGDGTATFGLPDLRSRVAICPGNGPGGIYGWGETDGAESINLSQANLPPHRHKISGNVYQPVLGENPGQSLSIDQAYMAATPGQNVYSKTKNGGNRQAPLKLSMQLQNTGGNQPMDNMQPFLVLNFMICMTGQFPPRP